MQSESVPTELVQVPAAVGAAEEENIRLSEVEEKVCRPWLTARFCYFNVV